jgi:hypothetical protein
MRTYGRITNPDGSKSWIVVTTDANGFDTPCWLTTLCQNFLLNLNESPFFANYGLPAQQSVLQQVQPDYYVAQIQRQFAQYFASLIVAKVPDVTTPTYNVAVVTPQGSKIVVQVPT